MEQEMFFWQAKFFPQFVHARKLVAGVRRVVRGLLQRIKVSIYQKSLVKYIREALPELKAGEAAKATFFHEVTDKKLPPCHFMVGNLLVWNDSFIEKNHPVRKHCGEGPFLVVRDESYLMEIEVTKSCCGKRWVRGGNDRVVLWNLRDQNLIIAHGGLFIAVQKETEPLDEK